MAAMARRPIRGQSHLGAFRTQSVSPPERIWALTDCCISRTYEGTASELVSSTSPGREVLFSLRSFCPGRALQYDRERCGLLTGPVITPGRPSGIRAYMQPRPAFAGLAFACDAVVSNSGFRFLFSLSPVRTTWPATRPTHSFLKLRAYSLNVLPPGFRFLYGDHPADPFIAREWRNILPFCTRSRIRNEDLP